VRVALVSREYPPAARGGGIGTNTEITARALAERGHEVHVLTRGDGFVSVADGVTVHALHHRWVPQAAAERLVALRGIAAVVRRLRPDVVQAAEWEAEAWWIARFGRTPVVTRLATPTHILEELNHGRLLDETALVRRLEREQTQRSAAVYAPTSSIADRIAAEWRLASVELIPNPVDVDAVREQAASTAPPFDLPGRFVCFFGRLERRKGIESLATALANVLSRHPDVHAVLIGRDPGDEEGALRARVHAALAPVRDRILLTGELPREQALAIVARAEVVALPSLWESFGYVCVEAMALGRPVVASAAGGLVDIVEDGRSGRLVPPGDAAALAAALDDWLGDLGARASIGAEASRQANRFATEHVVGRIERLLEQAADKRLSPTIYRRGYRRHFRPDEPGPFQRLYERKRDAVLSQFAAGPRRRIVDVGGGYGRLAGPLAARHDVTLVDVSPEMLEEAGRRWPMLRSVEADARSLPFADGEFDALLALDLTPHLPDLEAGIRELARVVRSGGEVVVDTSNASPWWVPAYPGYVNWRPKRLLLTMRAGGVLPEWREVVRHHTPADARAALRASGLRVEQEQRFGPPWSAKWHLWWTVKA
jgi:glycogen(starch) synthase